MFVLDANAATAAAAEALGLEVTPAAKDWAFIGEATLDVAKTLPWYEKKKKTKSKLAKSKVNPSQRKYAVLTDQADQV